MGISIPTAAFPGIGAIMRMLEACKFNAMSFSRALIYCTLTPVLGRTSKAARVGPEQIFPIAASMPKLAKVCCKIEAFFFNSSKRDSGRRTFRLLKRWDCGRSGASPAVAKEDGEFLGDKRFGRSGLF